MSFTHEHPVLWVEIPVRDMDAARAFYEFVFGWTMTLHDEPPNPRLDFPATDPARGVAGHLYPGEPAAGGPTIHLALPDGVEAACDRVRAAGGTVLPMPVIDIPAGRFAYATDPDGTSLGLFQPAAP